MVAPVRGCVLVPGSSDVRADPMALPKGPRQRLAVCSVRGLRDSSCCRAVLLLDLEDERSAVQLQWAFLLQHATAGIAADGVGHTRWLSPDRAACCERHSLPADTALDVRGEAGFPQQHEGRARDRSTGGHAAAGRWTACAPHLRFRRLDD